MTCRGLKAEAEAILDGLSLLPVLRRYGDARVVGSVALDLIVKLDIDVHVLISDPDLLSVAQSVSRHLLDQAHVHEVRLSDYRASGAVKVGVDAYPGHSGIWSIDVWITNRPETIGFALVDRFKDSLSPEQRAAILQIKRHYHERGELRNGLSGLIYEAVVDRAVRSVEEFGKLGMWSRQR